MHRHGVVFYGSDEAFAEPVVDFAVRALQAGDPLILVATVDHFQAVRLTLEERGFDWDSICHRAGGAFHDAQKTLDSFMVGGMPDAVRFRHAMENVFAPWTGMSERWTVRVFGEMVDLLCRRGQTEAALALEGMWNELARSRRFSLLCAYSRGNLFREVNGAAYKSVCSLHDHLVPNEVGAA